MIEKTYKFKLKKIKPKVELLLPQVLSVLGGLIVSKIITNNSESIYGVYSKSMIWASYLFLVISPIGPIILGDYIRNVSNIVKRLFWVFLPAYVITLITGNLVLSIFFDRLVVLLYTTVLAYNRRWSTLAYLAMAYFLSRILFGFLSREVGLFNAYSILSFISLSVYVIIFQRLIFQGVEKKILWNNTLKKIWQMRLTYANFLGISLLGLVVLQGERAVLALKLSDKNFGILSICLFVSAAPQLLLDPIQNVVLRIKDVSYWKRILMDYRLYVVGLVLVWLVYYLLYLLSFYYYKNIEIFLTYKDESFYYTVSSFLIVFGSISGNIIIKEKGHSFLLKVNTLQAVLVIVYAALMFYDLLSLLEYVSILILTKILISVVIGQRIYTPYWKYMFVFVIVNILLRFGILSI